MKIVGPEDVNPEVRHCNYFKVKEDRGIWGPRTIPDYELVYIVAGEFSYSIAMSFLIFLIGTVYSDMEKIEKYGSFKVF